MTDYHVDKQACMQDAPMHEELAEVLQLQRQHWKPVAREMHRRWPDIWRSPSELDDAGFYASLVASFRHDPESTRALLWDVASDKRSPNWERLLYLPRGAYSNGARLLRTLDRDCEEELAADFDRRGIPASCRALADELAARGRPAYARVLDWLTPLYPELAPEADGDAATPTPMAFAPEAAESPDTTWEATLDELGLALEQARAEPFATDALEHAAAALAELRSLADARREAAVQRRQHTIAHVTAVLGRCREAWPKPEPPLPTLLSAAEHALAESALAIAPDILDALSRELDAHWNAAEHAQAQVADAKQAMAVAVAEDRDAEITHLLGEKQAAQAALAAARLAVGGALQGALQAFAAATGVTEPPNGSESGAPTHGLAADPEIPFGGTTAARPTPVNGAGDESTQAAAPQAAGPENALAPEHSVAEPSSGDEGMTQRLREVETGLPWPGEADDDADPDAPAPPGPTTDQPRSPPAILPVEVHPRQPPEHTTSQSDNGIGDSSLFVFESFCANRWIGPDSHCRRAPWIDAEFAPRLQAASVQALEQQQLAHLEVFSRALEARGARPLVAADDVRAMAEVLVQPEAESAGGTDDPRLPRLLTAAQQGAAREQVLIGTLLETLRPSDEAPPTDADRQVLLDAAAIASADLRSLLERLLTFRQHGDDGWGKLLKRYHGDATLTDAEVIEQLQAARERFQLRVKQLWSAAAGKVQRTHCRKAWSEFVERHVSPLAPILGPGAQVDDFTHWDIGWLANQVRKLTVRHAKIADRGEAKHADRTMMDKAAAEIADLAAELLRLAQLHSKRCAPPTFHGLELPLPELRALVSGPSLADSTEELCRLGIIALTSRKPLLAASGITEADRWRCPGLLPMLDSDGALAGRRWAPVLPVAAINAGNIVGAAALLLHADDRVPLTGDMPHALRSRLLETGRSDLLPYLVGAEAFDVAEKTRIQRALSERVEALNQKLRTLAELRRDITALALPSAAEVDSAYESARQLLEDRERVHRELPLIASWLDALVDALTDELSRNLASLRSHADGLEDAEHRAAVLAELDAGRFALALDRLRDKQAMARGGGGDALRQTAWRRDARQRFPEPLQTLKAAAGDSDLGELPSLWLRQRGGADAQAAAKLRRAFYDFVSGEGDLSPTRKRRIVPKELREIRSSQIVVNCAELLSLLAKEGMNPSFVPQLRDFSELVIASPPAGITPTKAPNQLSRDVAEERDSRKLVVFLMPGLPEPARERILAELRGRELRSAGAVLDDLDLCRLIGEDAGQRPHGMLGLIELVFEQLNWKDLSPYVSRDGQFIQMEMFVGREREADKLALTAEYTRIFSGRKLGKSALLKYVQQTYSGARLPSGNELQVLYIIVAGGDSENWLTDKVLAEIRTRFADAPQVPDKADPGDRLEIFLETFFQQRSAVSLLVILDEADAFVEGQLKEYDRVRERCLSFRMMKTTFGGVDQNDLPRIRFVFSGYRVTNSRAGAWANAGSILRLSPLGEDDAVKLVAGPLARLGIDASAQAATIARYCGFQPAIIIRFCDALLKQVQHTYAAAGRREATITYEDVVNTFHHGGVQDEIRTINDNNFQGNRVGRIVFWTMLLAFNDLLSGQGLDNAPAELLARLRSIDPDTGWLRRLDPSETGEIQRNLHDFRDRALIEERRQPNGSMYRMKFPAHLPVLMTEEDPEHQIRQDIQRVRDGGHEAHFVTSLLTPKQIDDLHFALGADGAGMGIAVAVAASPWLDALQDDRGGVVDRLGYRGDAVRDGADGAAVPQDAALLLIHNATAALAGRLVDARNPALPTPLFIGGLDLMRWALERASGAMVAYVGLRRLDEARLTWWYERLRNVHFDTHDAIARIMSLTSGMPLLLRVWEELMPAQAEIGRDRFEALCEAFERQLPRAAEQLAGSDSALALTPRERELLCMAARVGRESESAFNLHDELAESWDTWAELLVGDIAAVPPLYAVDGDEVAVSLLIETGFIPVNGKGEVVFHPEDAVYRLFAGAT